MVGEKQREVRMSGKKRSGNVPRMHRRVHRQVREEVWKVMARRYKDYDPKWYNSPFPRERWHESRKPKEDS